MATKKPPSSKSRTTTKPAPQPTRLQNLAAKPASFDDTIDDQLVDASGVFRVTSSITQAQTGHDEDQGLRFPSDSLAIQAQRDGFRDDGPTIDEAVEDKLLDDEATQATKRQRLATLAARNQARRPRR
jgi:hypothetical protein